MHSFNFGIGGDRTEHVLWRLENGELDEVAPKVIVLLVGTNNHGDLADQIADGIRAIITHIRDKQPQAYLVEKHFFLCTVGVRIPNIRIQNQFNIQTL